MNGTGAERRRTPVPCRIETREGDDGVAAVIVGYASVFYDGTDGSEYQLWDGAVERIMPGTFTRAVKEDDVMGLFNHDGNQILGRTANDTMRLEVDKRGLKFEMDPPPTRTAEEVIALVRRGDVDGSSFAFIVTDQAWRTEDEIDLREIKGVRLFDVGPVVWPAYTGTTAGTRSDGPNEARESWELWQKSLMEARNALVSSKAARRSRHIRILEHESAFTPQR